jgi:D-alanine-D-alanine ligase
MSAPLEIALLFGGRSGEHEVSLRSALSVAAGLAARHRVRPVLIDHDGRWFLQDGPEPRADGGEAVFLAGLPTDEGRLRRLADAKSALRPDVYFPMLHGPFGEDGTIQGLLELAGVPYVGSGVAASAAGMDKEMMKALFAAASIPQTAYRVVRDVPAERAQALALPDELGLPLFVKPANMGSSVAVSKVKRAEDLAGALDLALAFDRKAVVEAGIDAREIEVSVSGNEEPEASLPGEIVPDREFYDYDSKYSSESRTELVIPAALTADETQAVRALGVRAFRAVDACGYARVDLLMDRASGRLHVNEINTIPGFTSISMFPKMWEATGVPMPALLDRLLELGQDRHARRARLRTRYQP